MKILITGSSGMLGSALCGELSKHPEHKVAGLDAASPASSIKPDIFLRCDITDYAALGKAFADIRPDIVIHAAAFTDVDGCELEPNKAETINAVGTRYVAEAAFGCGAVLMYISTDFVFDGRKQSPYAENDVPNPLNVYGRSKLDGEKFTAEIMKARDYFIIRTSWMFGSNGKNFVDTILNKAKNEKSIRVISDQFGSPTYAVDLARGIGRLLGAYAARKDARGIFHITNSDDCSWYRLAQKSLQIASIYSVELVPIISSELNKAAERPSMSILDNSRFIGATGGPLRPWQKALEEYISNKRATYGTK